MFDPGTQEVKAAEARSSRSASPTQEVLDHPELQDKVSNHKIHNQFLRDLLLKV